MFFLTGRDFRADNYEKTYWIRINETEVEIDPITIINDVIPETDEVFSISLEKGMESDTLNIFPSTSPKEITIEDNDGRGSLITNMLLNVAVVYIRQ